jgi:methyltransferase family protein
VANAYDQLVIDVPALYRRFPIDAVSRWPVPHASPPATFYQRLPTRVWQVLHRLRLDQVWFNTFATYWNAVLGGRSLFGVEDFHFLRGVYRLRHQGSTLADTNDPAEHLAAWQQPDLLYQLFMQVYVESIAPKLAALAWLRRVESFLEYGCATAPVIQTYRTFLGNRARAYALDLPTVSLHYAAYRFAWSDRTIVQPLSVEQQLRPPELSVDAIVCLQVFEHLLEPLEIVRRFDAMLPTGGFLIFDYHASEGAGLDSVAGARDRAAVLRCIQERFTIVTGDGASHVTVAQKR